jgi:hypothetical protein
MAKDETLLKLMHMFSMAQLPVLLILMSYFPAPEFAVYTTNLRNITTREMDIDLDDYSTSALYLATSGITAAFALASSNAELDRESRYSMEALQDLSSWDMGFWFSMLFHHGTLISFMCTPCDWYFLVLTVAGSTLLMMLMARMPMVDASRSRDYVVQFVALGLIFMLYTAVQKHNHMGFFGGMLAMNVMVLIGHTFDPDPNMMTVGNCRLFYTAGMSVMLLVSFTQKGGAY